jgi:hypothetical protein
MKCYVLSILFIAFSFSKIAAQPSGGAWQWAQKAGGVFNTNFGEDEVVNDICTDKYGNVYTTGIVYDYPYFNGVRYIPPFASFGGPDAFVAKYDKCGSLKWVRFGGSPQHDGSVAIHVDDSLNVYIFGYVGPLGHFPDSTHTLSIRDSAYGGLFWAKYDSLGNIKWVNVANPSNELPLYPSTFTTKPNGDLSIVLLLDTGSFYPGFNFTTTHPCDAIFEFDLNGNPISMLPIDSFGLNTSSYNTNFLDIAYDSKGNAILAYSIYDTIKLIDTVLNCPANGYRSFLFKANLQTNKIIWIKEWQEDLFGISGFVHLNVDNNDNIYANGDMGLNSVFNGDSSLFNTTASLGMAGIFKLDSNGNTIWRDLSDNTDNANIGVNTLPFTIYGNQYVCVPINVSGPTYWGGDTLYSGVAGSGPNPFFMTFLDNTNGKVVYADSLAWSNTLTCAIFKILADQEGNLLLGGLFSSSLIAGDTITYIGGINDAFVVKWGLPCPDTDALIPPVPAGGLIASASGYTAIDVDWHNIGQYVDRYRIYRSTIDSVTGYSLIDSVGNAIEHYTDVNVSTNQIYWYKVSAVNNAGEAYSNSDSAVIIPTGIAQVNTAIRHISLYPNPADAYTELSVWSETSFTATITLTDIEGREFYSNQTSIAQGKNDYMIDLSGISDGVYMVNMNSNNGSYSKRLVVVK